MIYEPNNTETEWILASHFEADQTEVVHHAIITMADGGLRDAAERLDEGEPGPGWTCYGGTGLEASGFSGLTRTGGWAPGGPVDRRPDGHALEMAPGSFFVIQIHYHYDGDYPADSSRFVLDLASDAGRVTSVTGHMHELGSSIRLTVNPDTPEEQILLDIPDWDFEWQFGYRPIDDVILERGDIIRVDCAWGRDRAPFDPVGYVLWSDGTGDEMCFSSITTAPDES